MKRLIACGDCRRQYDVSHHAIGHRVLCICETELEVTESPPREVEARRCAGCGAPFDHDGRECAYCHRVTDLSEHRLSSICPECFGRMPDDAKFCSGCGIVIDPRSLVAIPADADCPRCDGLLRSRDLGETSIVECASCFGLWLPPQTFEALIQQSKLRGAQGTGLATVIASDHSVERREFRYLPCPVCRDLMVPRNFAGKSGILIDLCKSHGVWLDAGELEAIARFCTTNPALANPESSLTSVAARAWSIPRGSSQTPENASSARPLTMIMDAAQAILEVFGVDLFS